MEKKRSKGLMVFATLEILFGLLGLVGSNQCAITTAAYSGISTSNAFVLMFFPETFFIFLFFLILSMAPVLAILSGIGMFKLRNWGRILGIAAASVFLAIVQILILIWLLPTYLYYATHRIGTWEGYGPFFSLLFITFFLVWCIYYLTRPKVKEQFK